jgi:CMP-N-acetylneuraminic acid synthetase
VITAFIPARGADDKLENKNTLPFGNSDLLTHKILQLKQCPKIKEIIVSSDCLIIGELAESAGAKFIERPGELSNLNADFNLFCEYVATLVNHEHVLWAPVTCPLVTSFIFNECIDIYLGAIEQGYDSLITVNSIKRFLLDDNGPLNFRFMRSIRDSARLPVLYEFVNAVCICEKSDMAKWKYNWGKNPYKYQLPVHMQVDICDEFDYRLSKLIHGDQN